MHDPHSLTHCPLFPSPVTGGGEKGAGRAEVVES